MPFKYTLFTLTALCLLSCRAEARVINIPQDFDTIQEGIDSTQAGDTVLVSPGRYVENITFPGYGITLASLLLTTGDRDFIAQTIIDGDSLDCCVAFNRAENDSALLQGFTLTRGIQDFGGGVDIQNNAAPRLQDLVITGNWARQIGAGIYVTWNATPLIERVVIENNRAFQGGGVGSAHEAHPTLRDCVIRDNFAEFQGGGVYCGHGDGEITLEHVLITGNQAGLAGAAYLEWSRDNLFDRVTIAGNRADSLSGIVTYGSGAVYTKLLVANSIIHAPDFPVIAISHAGAQTADSLIVEYSLLFGGVERARLVGNAVIEWGEGALADDPLFADPEGADFTLRTNSPCIDAADPDLPRDDDGTRADMGYFPYLGRGTLQGFVFDAANDQPLEGATVTTSYGLAAQSDAEGFWRIDTARWGDFSLTAALDGYNEAVAEDQHLEIGDTLSVEFSLTHPEISAAPEQLALTADLGELIQTQITIRNDGNGPLSWQATPRNAGEFGAEPWTMRDSIEFMDREWNQVVGLHPYGEDLLLQSRLMETGRTHLIRLDGMLNLLDTLLSMERWMFDTLRFAWDGKYMWMHGDGMLYVLDIAGQVEVVNRIAAAGVTALAWDSDREVMWTAGGNGALTAYDLEGQAVDNVQTGIAGIYGAAYWSEPLERFNLYLYSTDGDSTQTLTGFDPQLREWRHLTDIQADSLWTPAGVAIGRDYDAYSNKVCYTLERGTNQSIIRVWQLETNTAWFMEDLLEGGIAADEQESIELTIGAGLEEAGEYVGEISIAHNALGVGITIPLTLRMGLDSAPVENILPEEFTITSAYPNPFNSQLRLSYTLPQPGEVTLTIHDLAGRRVDAYIAGRQDAGMHELTLDAAGWASGIYVANLQSGSLSAVMKVVCIK